MMSDGCLDNALRNHPLRIKVHSLYATVEERRLGLEASYAYAHGHAFLAVHGKKMHGRDVYEHVLAVVLRIVAVVPSASFDVCLKALQVCL